MSKNPTNSLVWKPKAAFWISLVFLLFGVLALGVFYFESTKSLFDWICLILYIPWTAIALFGTIHGLRTRVEADENGVRWRDWRGVWRAAKWEEVSDFHKRSTTNENGSTHRVETAQGNFEFGLEGDGKAIAEIVARRALSAPVREWEIKGERLSDPWPRRFEFYQPGLEVAARNTFFVLLAFFGLTAYLLLRLQPRGDLAPSVWFLAYVGPFLMLPVLPALVWLYCFTSARQARPFRGQSVEVSPTGIVFNGPTRVEAKWPQVEEGNWIRRGKIRTLELKTADGNVEIPVSGFRLGALCRIIERFSGVSLVKNHDEDSMANHPVQNAPNGTLIFGFSVVDSQLVRWLFPLLGLTLCFMPSLMHLADPQRPVQDEISVVVVGAALFVVSVSFNWCLQRAQLRLTPDALEWRGPFMHRVVAWRDIESYGSKPDGLSWIVVDGRKISLSWMLTTVPQRSRLREEISQRAFNATGEWQEKSPRKR